MGTSTVIVVRRCALTVRGRGGWSWGANPTRYLETAMPAIDRALQQVITEAGLPEDVELHVVQPVRLLWRPDHTLDDGARQALVSALRAAVPATTRSDGPAAAAAAVPDEPGLVEDSRAAPVRDAKASKRLAALLGGWSRSGRLPRIVATWPEATVRRWTRAVTASASDPETVELADAAVVAIAETVLSQAQWSQRAPLREADQLIVVLAALVSAAGDRPLSADTLRRAAAAAGATLAPEPDAAGASSTPRPAAAARTPAASDRPTVAAARVPDRAVAVPGRLTAPGLPFLVLVQLGRVGYLDALWAVAAASAPDPDAVGRGLAGGLAGKMLPPPRRGWSRTAEETAAVLLAAGLGSEQWDRAAHAVRQQADVLVPPLQSALVALYADGRPAGGIEVSETVDGLICGEAEGALPIGWVGGRDEVSDILGQLGDPPSSPSDRFAAMAVALHARRGFPGVDLPVLERHLGAAVGTALGSLGAELWEAEALDAPMLALERLAGLEVELRPAASRHGPAMSIAVPRGQRWLDLRRVGLLGRWALPWTPRGWELVTW
jgi:hypothetical protein